MVVKNFLILLNSAPKLSFYHIALGEALEKDGHNVVYAIDDMFPLCMDKIDLSKKKVYIFSDYLKTNCYKDIQIPEKYKNLNLNKCVFSDYDREIIHYHKKIPFKHFLESWSKCMVLFFDNIISKNDIDICINEAVSNTFSYIAFSILKINGIDYCGYAACRLKDRFELYTEEFCSVNKLKNEFDYQIQQNSLIDDDINEYLLSFKIQNEMPSYHPKGTKLDWNYSIFKIIFSKDLLNYFKANFTYQKKYRNDLKYSYFKSTALKTFFRLANARINKLIRTKFLMKSFDEVNITDQYYLYPLHFKPEASTSVLARHYCNDIAVLENIAFNLPNGRKLYVKEHFVNYGRAPKSFYDAIKRIPNVRLISPNVNTKHLIEKSLGVITLTSTVGYEALLMNKPVWVFGNVFYMHHPNCRKINNYDQLFSSLSDLSIMNNSDEINGKFIQAYKNISYPGSISYHIWEKSYDAERFIKTFKPAIYDYFKISK